MAHLQYYNYSGVGTQNLEKFHYSQAVRVGDLIYCSGQGGWKPDASSSAEVVTEINAQIDQAFVTVDHNLRHAGGKGWSQVFSVNSYHVPLNNEVLAAMTRNFRKWCPDHKPTFTCVGVQRLGEDDMRVEIQVIAHDPEGAKAEREKMEARTAAE